MPVWRKALEDNAEQVTVGDVFDFKDSMGLFPNFC